MLFTGKGLPLPARLTPVSYTHLDVYKRQELPSGAATTVDGNTLIVSSTVPRHNFYPVFNKKFLRLKPGINELKASGSADLTISCLFPRKAGI